MQYKLGSKFKKITIVLILIQLVSISVISLQNKIYLWDEAAYILNGMDIAHKPISPVMQQYVAHERHPLLSWIIAALAYSNTPLIFYNLISPFSLFLFIILIYKMGEKLYNKDVGMVSSFILISIPAILFMSVKIMTDVPAALLFSASLYFYYLGLEKPKYFLLGGLIGGISIIMKDMNFLLIPILFIFTLVFWKKISIKYYLYSIFIAFISILPYLIDNFQRWGNPLYRILAHIEMVNQGVGYHSFPLQDISFSWIIFLPIFLGIPIFYLFVLNLYRNRKRLYSNPNLRFLLVWFIVPFTIFLFGQKIDYRLTFIFAVPILLIGSNELLSKSKDKFKIFMVIILVLNGFLLSNLIIFNQIKLSNSHKECFDFIEKNISYNQIIFSNADPPSVVAWYTNRTVAYSINPDSESHLNYYLYDKKYSEMLPMFIKNIPINSKNYTIIFNNSRYTLYQKIK